MKKVWLLTVLFLLILSACGGQPSQLTPPTVDTATPTAVPPTNTPIVPTSTPIPAATLSIPEGYLNSTIPVSGEYIPDFEKLDKALLDFIQQRNIGAAQMVVVKDGVVILNHAYGWYDLKHTRPFTTDGVMRIASVTKPITLAAIRNLMGKGKVAGAQKVFCLDGSPANCLLKIEPLPGAKIDPRLKDISVNNLIEHKGGWDRDASFDPMFASIKISKSLGVDSPPDKYQIAQYMLGQPLDFKPGTKETYSNFGYSLLGQIIEKVTGKTYIQYIQEDLFAPLGVTDVYLGATAPESRLPNEPYYTCTGKGKSVLKPGTQVCWPDGGWSIEGMDSHGGLITSATALGKFLDAYCIDGKPSTGSGSCGTFAFFGSLDGTLSLVVQQPGGINYVIILNNRWDEKNGNYDNIKDLIDGVMKLIN
jgi:CubicO group peptidase (beta-lactamase class C family)